MTTERNDDGMVLEAKPKKKTKRPPKYKVILLNDDYTPMDFVVVLVQSVFHKSYEEANAITMAIHKKGAGVAGIYTAEVAEHKAAMVIEYATLNQHPLKAIVEPDEEGDD